MSSWGDVSIGEDLHLHGHTLAFFGPTAVNENDIITRLDSHGAVTRGMTVAVAVKGVNLDKERKYSGGSFEQKLSCIGQIVYFSYTTNIDLFA